VRCSAYAETLEFDKGWASRSEMLPSRDKTLRVFRVDQFFGVALGVPMDIDEKTSLGRYSACAAHCLAPQLRGSPFSSSADSRS
jgi:hypothetical protein